MTIGWGVHRVPKEVATPMIDRRNWALAMVLLLGACGEQADEVVAGWLASPPHRRILLDRRATESGIGVAVGARERIPRITWVELVAAPAAPR